MAGGELWEARSKGGPILWATVRTLAFIVWLWAEEKCDLTWVVSDPSHCLEEDGWSVVRAEAAGPAGRLLQSSGQAPMVDWVWQRTWGTQGSEDP